MDETILISRMSLSILNSINGERGHSAPSTFNTSLQQAANTVYERHSQCSGVFTEISPTLCDDTFLSLLKDNVQITFSSTKRSKLSTGELLVKNWGIV